MTNKQSKTKNYFVYETNWKFVLDGKAEGFTAAVLNKSTLVFQDAKERINETLTCRYIANGENRLLLGPPGVGMTHLAIAFTLEALTQGYIVLFITAADLVAECHKAEAREIATPAFSSVRKRLTPNSSTEILDHVNIVQYFSIAVSCFSSPAPQ